MFRTLTRRLLCHPRVGRTVGRLFRQTLPAYGSWYDTSSPLFADKWKAALFWRYYERPEVVFVQRHLDPGLDVIELGSSLGVVSVVIAKKLQSSRKLVCVEANPLLIPVVERNLCLNGATNARVVHGAIHYGSPTARLVVNRGQLGARLASHREAPGIDVATTTLKTLIAQHEIREPYTLVCDIEGAEAEILANDSEMLKACRDVVIELHDTTCPVTGMPLVVDDLQRRFVYLGFALRAQTSRVFFFTKA